MAKTIQPIFTKLGQNVTPEPRKKLLDVVGNPLRYVTVKVRVKLGGERTMLCSATFGF